jgi:hypothetical protein
MDITEETLKYGNFVIINEAAIADLDEDVIEFSARCLAEQMNKSMLKIEEEMLKESIEELK